MPAPDATTVLIVDDDAKARDVLATRLRHWGYGVVCANSAEAALAILATSECPKIAIVDWMMPGMSGVELAVEIRRRVEEYVYVLMLTCRAAHQDLLAALDAGVDDYLAKPCHTGELELRLRAGVRVVALQKRLRQMADHDPLTGCWNRRRFVRFLCDELARARRHCEPLAAVMVDVDHFKRINDTFGHAAGDAVLRQLATLIPANLRKYDRFGRIGGEEFVVALPAAGPEDARAAAWRLREVVAAHPVLVGDEAIDVTASFGVAASMPSGHVDAEELLRRADAALYAAKAQGRDCVASWLPAGGGVAPGTCSRSRVAVT
jgi:diguanylate cyclase (GGDEF)-like protein